MKLVYLDVHLISPGDRDYPKIWDWLSKNGVDVAWVKMPSEVKVYDDAIVTLEYLHEDDGTLVREKGAPALAYVRYEGLKEPMPDLEHTRVTDV